MVLWYFDTCEIVFKLLFLFTKHFIYFVLSNHNGKQQYLDLVFGLMTFYCNNQCYNVFQIECFCYHHCTI